MSRPMTKAPRWDGQDVAGRTIVVCAEGGFGDQIMFGRFLGPLRDLGANVVVACGPPLVPWFVDLGYTAQTMYQDGPIGPCDYWTHFGSLPLGLGLSDLPPAAYALPDLVGFGVGVMAKGNPDAAALAHRSLPDPLAKQLETLGRNLHPSATGATDFRQTAAIIATLSSVISVDTSVAHLAGAMGKELSVLLPWRLLDWRWGYGDVSPWYPEAKLLRQDASEDWSSFLGT